MLPTPLVPGAALSTDLARAQDEAARLRDFQDVLKRCEAERLAEAEARCSALRQQAAADAVTGDARLEAALQGHAAEVAAAEARMDALHGEAPLPLASCRRRMMPPRDGARAAAKGAGRHAAMLYRQGRQQCHVRSALITRAAHTLPFSGLHTMRTLQVKSAQRQSATAARCATWTLPTSRRQWWQRICCRHGGTRLKCGTRTPQRRRQLKSWRRGCRWDGGWYLPLHGQ